MEEKGGRDILHRFSNSSLGYDLKLQVLGVMANKPFKALPEKAMPSGSFVEGTNVHTPRE
jgi:hypothetical protein